LGSSSIESAETFFHGLTVIEMCQRSVVIPEEGMIRDHPVLDKLLFLKYEEVAKRSTGI